MTISLPHIAWIDSVLGYGLCHLWILVEEYVPIVVKISNNVADRQTSLGVVEKEPSDDLVDGCLHPGPIKGQDMALLYFFGGLD